MQHFDIWRLTRDDRLMRAIPLALLSIAAIANAQAEPYPATLAGHVIVPAQTFIQPPADAPADLKTSGKFTTATRLSLIHI